MSMPLDYDIASSPPPFMLNYDYGELTQEFVNISIEKFFHVNFICNPSVAFAHTICTLSMHLFTPLTYFSNDGLHRIPLKMEQINFSLEQFPISLDYFPCDESIVNFLGGYTHLPYCYKDVYPSFLNMDDYFS